MMNTIAISSTMRALAVAIAAAALGAGCGKEAPKGPPQRPPADVTVMTVTATDTPVTFEFVGQTQSSREVEIRARVEGFLDKRLYTEGDLVRAGQPLFQIDTKPFNATLQSAKGQVEQQQAALATAVANLNRIRPLAEQNAVSKKDLDDAIGAEQRARAAVFAAQGQLQTAQLNLGYTTVFSPLTGLSSFAKLQEGSYLSASNNLLTTISQLDPIWVNFSISENETNRYRDEVARKILRLPDDSRFSVEVVLADGTVFPYRGEISFADPSFSKETGTFLVRAVIANPKAQLRPGQFVRVHVLGALRPASILVPQRAVQQGAKSHFVWVVDNDGKAEQRPVEVGSWNGDDWFITDGLRSGERVVVDGAIRVSPGAALKITPYAPPPAPTKAPPKAADPLDFELDQATGKSASKRTTSSRPAPARDAAAPASPSRSATPSSAAVRDVMPPSAPAGSATTASAAAKDAVPSDAPARNAASSSAAPASGAGASSTATAGTSKVYFETDSDVLTPQSAQALGPLARILANDPQTSVHITGYADKTGTSARNMRLALDRAKAVRAALIAHGARPEQTMLKAPAAVTGGDDDREARRVEVTQVAARAAPKAAPR